MLSNLVSSGVFYLIASVIIIFAVLTVTLKNIFHSALSLITVLLAVAAIYIYLEAEFLAVAQILIYVGAIMALIIFAIMLTLKISDKSLKQNNEQKLISFLIAASMAIFLISILIQISSNVKTTSFNSPSLVDIGGELLTKYALPFEVISLILLAALIAAAVVSRKD